MPDRGDVLPEGWEVDSLYTYGDDDPRDRDPEHVTDDDYIASADAIIVHNTETDDYYTIHGADDLEALADLLDHLLAGYEEA